MKIAICDDEKIMQEYLKKEIDFYFQSLDVLTLCYGSGEELLADCEKKQYDIVFNTKFHQRFNFFPKRT